MPVAQQATSPVEQEAQTLAGYESSVDAARAYMPHDIDTSVVPAIDVDVDGSEVVKMKLPDDVSSLLETAASRLNKGLGGDSSRT